MKKALVWTGSVLAFALILGLIPVMGVTDGPQDAAAQVQGAVVDETLYVVSRFQSDTPNGITAFRSSTIVTMTNTDDRTCAYILRWRDNDGTRVLCTLPGTISSGETKVFCSRRLDDNGLLSTCDFTCGVDTPAAEELVVGNEGIIFIDRETNSSKGSANNIVIDAAIYHTIGPRDDTVQGVYDPNIVKANKGDTRNKGD